MTYWKPEKRLKHPTKGEKSPQKKQFYKDLNEVQFGLPCATCCRNIQKLNLHVSWQVERAGSSTNDNLFSEQRNNVVREAERKGCPNSLAFLKSVDIS